MMAHHHHDYAGAAAFVVWVIVGSLAFIGLMAGLVWWWL